jgi:hypothetical protein
MIWRSFPALDDASGLQASGMTFVTPALQLCFPGARLEYGLVGGFHRRSKADESPRILPWSFTV